MVLRLAQCHELALQGGDREKSRVLHHSSSKYLGSDARTSFGVFVVFLMTSLLVASGETEAVEVRPAYVPVQATAYKLLMCL